LNTPDWYIQENAQVFQSMHAQIQKQFKHMDAKLETLHKIVHIVETDTFALAHSNYKPMHCGIHCTLMKLYAWMWFEFGILIFGIGFKICGTMQFCC
jgi:hypothetical protein